MEEREQEREKEMERKRRAEHQTVEDDRPERSTKRREDR